MITNSTRARLKRMILSVVIPTMLPAPSSGQANFFDLKAVPVRAILPGRIVSEEISLTLLLDAHKSGGPCELDGYDSDRATIFVCLAPLGNHSAVFSFRIPGYNRYNTKALKLHVKERTDDVALGVVPLTDSSEPRIEGVRRVQPKDGSIQFNITVANRSHKPIELTQINMESELEDECDHRPLAPAVLAISTKLLLDVRETAAATLDSESGEHRQVPAQLVGRVRFQDCGESALAFQTAVGLKVPPQHGIEIQLIVPPHALQALTQNTPSTDGQQVTRGMTSWRLMGQFGSILFTLVLSNGAHPEESLRYQEGGLLTD